jgi:hypothetical protein
MKKEKRFLCIGNVASENLGTEAAFCLTMKKVSVPFPQCDIISGAPVLSGMNVKMLLPRAGIHS